MADRPVCGALGFLRAQEVWCVRPPHRHGDHQNEAGDRWPSYEGENDTMLVVSTNDLRSLLSAQHEDPVLYVARDEDTGKPVRLDVWAEALAPHGDVIVRQHELVDALGGPDHPDGVTEDALENLLEGYQAEVDEKEEAAREPDGVYDGEIR